MKLGDFLARVCKELPKSQCVNPHIPFLQILELELFEIQRVTFSDAPCINHAKQPQVILFPPPRFVPLVSCSSNWPQHSNPNIHVFILDICCWEVMPTPSRWGSELPETMVTLSGQDHGQASECEIDL